MQNTDAHYRRKHVAGNLKDVDQRLLRDPKRPPHVQGGSWPLAPPHWQAIRVPIPLHKGVARYLSIPLSRSRLIEE